MRNLFRTVIVLVIVTVSCVMNENSSVSSKFIGVDGDLLVKLMLTPLVLIGVGRLMRMILPQ